MALVHSRIAENNAGSVAGRLASVLAVAVALGLVAAAMFLPVAQSSDATTTGYAIRRNQQELADVQAQIHSTEAAIADLGSMSRIASQAKQIGMVPASGKALSVTVTTSPTDQVLLPRRFLPPPVPEDTADAGSHSRLWSLLHSISLH